ncbi:MAG: hypothetical protein ACI94Y_002492 [Maribacter sp.]|jgi:hypothetical protein
MKKHLFGFLILFITIAFMSCGEDNSTDNSGRYEKGIFIVNEGQFGVGNGSISYYDDEADSTALEIFQAINNRPLGDVVQSISFHNDYAYIVVNNSNKVEVVNANTFEEVATISGLVLPSHFMGINDNKGYVSQWGWNGKSGSIQIIDLNSNMVIDSIVTGSSGPNKMYMFNDKVYVGHNGGFGFDESFFIVNPVNDAIIETISTNYNPDEMAIDANGNLWVLSKGYFDFITNDSYTAFLTAYDSDHNILKDFELSSNYPSDLFMSADEDQLFFILNGEVLSVNPNSSTLDITVVANDAYFYSLGYDASEKKLYVGDAVDYVSQGNVRVYDESGSLLNTINAGVVPGEINTSR